MEYDQRGNLTATKFGDYTLAQYTFDESGKLSKAINWKGDVTTYTYDGLNRRVNTTTKKMTTLDLSKFKLFNDSKCTPNGNDKGSVLFNWINKTVSEQSYDTKDYTMDITSPYNSVIMVSEGDKTLQKYTYGLELLSVDNIPAKSSLYYLQDELGSPVRITGEKGNTVERYSYDEFGRPIMSKPDKTGNLFGFTGYQYDSSTGLYYAQARYYMPEIGRFISEDSYRGKVSDPLSLNLYTYCVANPVNRVDPSGYEPNQLQSFRLNDMINNIKRIEEKNPSFTPFEILNAIAVKQLDASDKSSPEINYYYDYNSYRYIYTKKGGWIDMQHFFAAAVQGCKYGWTSAELLGFSVESIIQGAASKIKDGEVDESYFSYEDLPSNYRGGVFGESLQNEGRKYGLSSWEKLQNLFGAKIAPRKLSDMLKTYFEDLGAKCPETAPNWYSMPAKPNAPGDDGYPKNHTRNPYNFGSN